MIYVVPSLDLVVWRLAGRDDQYDGVNTGLPVHPDVPPSGSRRAWEHTVKDSDAQRLILQKIVESIVEDGRPG